MASSKQKFGPLALRFIAATGLLFLVEVWVQAHFGIQLLESIQGASFFVVITFMLGVLAFVGGEKAEEGVTGWVRKKLQFVFQTKFLAVAAVVFLLVTLFRSSVKVRSAEGSFTATVFAGTNETASKKAEDKEEEILLPVAITPMGRMYSVEVDGYNATQVMVRPWFPKKLVAGTDVTIKPTVFIRVAHSNLIEGNTIVLRTVGAESKMLATQTLTAAGRGGLVVGPRRPLAGLEEQWKAELGLMELSEGNWEVILEAWRDAQICAEDVALHPGQKLEVTLTKPRGSKFIKVFDVTDAPIQEIVIGNQQP